MLEEVGDLNGQQPDGSSNLNDGPLEDDGGEVLTLEVQVGDEEEVPGGVDLVESQDRTHRRRTLDLVEDCFHTPIDEVNKMSVGFKIHLGVAFVLCLASFFGFHFSSLVYYETNPSSLFPWWMFPWFFFAMTLGGHHFYSKGNYWTGTVIIIIILHIALFITNKILTPQIDWFWYPLLLCLMYGMYHYYTITKAPPLRIFSYIYMIFSALVFITWLNLHTVTEFPWFVYPIVVTGMPLLLWYMYEVYGERRWYLYGGVVSVGVNVIVLISWGFMDTVWPWFFIPMILCFLLNLLWWFLYTKGCGRTWCVCSCCSCCIKKNNPPQQLFDSQ